MAETRTYQGQTYTRNAPGEPWVLVPPSTGRVVALPQDPTEVAKDARNAADQAADNARADAALDIQRQTAESMNELRQLQAQAAREKLNEGKARQTTLDALKKQVDRVQTLFNSNVEGFNWNIPAIGTALPTEANRQFDTAGAQLSSLGLAAFRVPGTGTVSDRDAIMFDRANLPSADKYDSSIEEQLRGIRSRVESEYAALGLDPPQWAGVSQQRADNEAPGQTTGGADKAPPSDPGDPGALPPANSPGGDYPSPAPERVASGSTRFENDPRLSGLVNSLMNAGASKAMIDAALAERGMPPISYAEYTAAKNWMKANPGKKYTGANAQREVPLSLMEKAAGSGAGAFTAQMADAATGGIPGYLAGEQGKGALEAMSLTHPDASLLGTITGGVTGAGMAEVGLAARAGRLAKYAPRAADAMFGATSGFTGAEDGSRVEGAAAGALLAPIAGKIGEKVVGGAGSMLKGVTDPTVQYLRGLNIPLTVGQTLSQSGRLGAGVKKIEDALTSIPGVGNMIDARRTEGLEGFNRAAFDIGAETTGQQVEDYGAAGLNQLRGLVGDSYSRALDPVQINADTPEFIDALANTIQSAQRIPNVNGAQDAAMAALKSRIEGAVDPETSFMGGRGFQEAYRGLARTGRERANSDYGHEVGQVMREGQDALASTLEQQNPGAYSGFLDANSANRRLNILADAVGRARNADDDIFMPSQLEAADFANANKLTGKVAAASGTRPFAELAAAGQKILPSKLPDSGTTTRALTGLAIGGAAGGGTGYLAGDTGAGTGTGLGLTLALMLGGTKRGQRLATQLLLNRPDVIRAAGEGLKRNARIGGWTGAGILAPLVAGQ